MDHANINKRQREPLVLTEVDLVFMLPRHSKPIYFPYLHKPTYTYVNPAYFEDTETLKDANFDLADLIRCMALLWSSENT